MIELVNENDLPIVFQYLKQYFNVFYDKINTFEKIKIYKDKKIIGLISYSIIYDRAEINYILVLPEYRHKGVARLLINSMINDLEKVNVKDITLEVNENNISAIKLYEKYNFKKISIRRNYYGTMNGILMKKDLGG